MKKLKRTLFWITFLPFGMLQMICLTLEAIFGWLSELFHKYEDWCFGYSAKYEYIGGGVWRGKQPSITRSTGPK